MRRLCVTRESRPGRGGWILFECLRECGLVAVLLLMIVAGLQAFMPDSHLDDAAAAVSRTPVYSLGFDATGQQMWVTRWKTGWSLFDRYTQAELDNIGYGDGRVFQAEAAGPPERLMRVSAHEENAVVTVGSEAVAARRWPREDGAITDVCVQDNGQSAMVVSSSGVIGEWTWSGTALEFRRYQIGGPISRLALSADGHWAALVIDHDRLVVFDRHLGREVDRWQSDIHSVFMVAMSPDGRRIAFAGRDGKLSVWDRLTSRVIWETEADILATCALEFSPDGHVLATGGFDKIVHLRNASTGSVEHTLKGHDHTIRAIAFHPRENRLLTGTLGGEVFEWSLDTCQVIHRHDW